MWSGLKSMGQNKIIKKLKKMGFRYSDDLEGYYLHLYITKENNTVTLHFSLENFEVFIFDDVGHDWVELTTIKKIKQLKKFIKIVEPIKERVTKKQLKSLGFKHDNLSGKGDFSFLIQEKNNYYGIELYYRASDDNFFMMTTHDNFMTTETTELNISSFEELKTLIKIVS
jgi:hypothetical protein